MKESEYILNTKKEFFKFLKSKFILIHMSNVFFRDLHYGILSYLIEHGVKTSYRRGEQCAREIGAVLEKDGIFKNIDRNTWTLIYPEFALPRQEKKTA